jgi:ankyrin repeat protein
LLIAAQMNFTAVAEALVKAGANVNASDDRSKITPLQYAAIKGNSELAMLLLENKANPNISGHEDWTALHLAAQYGSHKVATLLITNKANVNARNDNRATPLHIAATHGRFAVVTLLLDHNASVDVKNKRGYTALRNAQEAKHERICQLLEKHANR